VVFGEFVILFLRIEFSAAMLTVIQRVILVSMIEKNDRHTLRSKRLAVLTWIKQGAGRSSARAPEPPQVR